MKFEIKFSDLEKANEFVETLKDQNLRGVKVFQYEKEPEEGALNMAEYVPLVILAVKSGFATAVVTQVFGLLKGVLVENKKTNSNERIEIERTNSKNKNVEFTVECNDVKLNFKFSKDNEEEMKQIMDTISSFEKNC